jgi:hypothetical protein
MLSRPSPLSNIAPPPDHQSMVTKIRNLLLSSMLGQHVGEALANTDTAIVGEGAAQGRATTRAGHCTGLTD